MKQLQKIKSSVLQRGLSLTKLTMNTGAKVASHGISTMFAGDKEKQDKWQKFLTSQAQIFSRELGELKGSLMKAGQMISMYGELFLPAEANEFLKTLQSQSPPLQFSEIEKILISQLGPEKLSKLEIDPESIGTASLGQVHRARIKSSGEWIALKVQYPGVEQAIESDLKAMRSMLKMLNLLPGELQTDVLFAEVKDMLRQEVQYRLEAEQTKKYRELFAQDNRFVVPRVYDEFCADKILATSFEKGLSPDDPLVKALSQERRNKLGLNYLEIYFKELFQYGYVQTDPHLGNYKIRLNPNGEDQLVLLDFGAVRQYDSQFLKSYHRMVKSALLRDSASLEKAALDLNFIGDADAPELKQLFQQFCLMTVEPFLDPSDEHMPQNLMDANGIYDWKQSDLPRRLTDILLKIIKNFPLRTPPRELVFLDRKTGGVFVFLSVLGVKIRARELLLHYSKDVQL